MRFSNGLIMFSLYFSFRKLVLRSLNSQEYRSGDDQKRLARLTMVLKSNRLVKSIVSISLVVQKKAVVYFFVDTDFKAVIGLGDYLINQG